MIDQTQGQMKSENQYNCDRLAKIMNYHITNDMCKEVFEEDMKQFQLVFVSAIASKILISFTEVN